MILDTSFLIDLLRKKDAKIKEKASELDSKFETKFISSISVMEIWRGALKSNNPEKETEEVNELLKSCLIIPFDEKSAKKAGEVEVELLKRGEMIDVEDIMIAGIAKIHNETILTRNTKHFKKIPDLKTETY